MSECRWMIDNKCEFDFSVCEDCKIFEPADATHKMVGCSEDCLAHACCDFCSFVIQDFWFEQDKNSEWNIVSGGPIGCALHKDKMHQDIAADCGYCEDYHCFRATSFKQVIKEMSE